MNIDFYGDDLRQVSGVSSPDQCCTQCRSTKGCKAYTFVKPTCYLKTGKGTPRTKVGAVSAWNGPSDPDPNPNPDPSQCSKPEVGVDYYGDDLAQQQYYGVPLEACCTKCGTTPGCKAYTYVPSNRACYLKKGTGERRSTPGLVSGTLLHPVVVPPGGGDKCTTPLWGRCGSAGSATCCPPGSYCQPWDVRVYQCIPTPTQCQRQYPNVDFYGEDLNVFYGLKPSQCCAKCATTPGCKAYTFVNDQVDKPACYLKKGMGTKRPHASAVSALVN